LSAKLLKLARLSWISPELAHAADESFVGGFVVLHTVCRARLVERRGNLEGGRDVVNRVLLQFEEQSDGFEIELKRVSRGGKRKKRRGETNRLQDVKSLPLQLFPRNPIHLLESVSHLSQVYRSNLQRHRLPRSILLVPTLLVALRDRAVAGVVAGTVEERNGESVNAATDAKLGMGLAEARLVGLAGDGRTDGEMRRGVGRQRRRRGQGSGERG
jgi:hypothetical protein